MCDKSFPLFRAVLARVSFPRDIKANGTERFTSLEDQEQGWGI
jgi:hypothetical protein